MKLPVFLYGRYKDVKTRCRKMVTAMRKGAAWNDLAGDMIDTADVSGLIVVGGPNPNLGADEHFHCFAPYRVLGDAIWVDERLAESVGEAIFRASLETHWGMLGLLGSGGRMFLREPEQRLQVVRSYLQFIDDFSAEGLRFSEGAQDGTSQWKTTNIGPTLAEFGGLTGPEIYEAMDVPSTPDALKDIIRRVLSESE